MSMWTNSEEIWWEGYRVLPQGAPPTLDGVRVKHADAHLIMLAALVVSVLSFWSAIMKPPMQRSIQTRCMETSW